MMEGYSFLMMFYNPLFLANQTVRGDRISPCKLRLAIGNLFRFSEPYTSNQLDFL